MIQLSLTMERGQDLPQRLERWGDTELHASMLRVANEVLAIYLPQLARDAPSGIKTVAGDVKLNESFSGRVVDSGLEVDANMYTASPQKLAWVTGGTRSHVIPMGSGPLHLEPELAHTTEWVWHDIEHPGINDAYVKSRGQFVNKIKDRIRSYVQYRYQQEIDVSVTRL